MSYKYEISFKINKKSDSPTMGFRSDNIKNDVAVNVVMDFKSDNISEIEAIEKIILEKILSEKEAGE